MGSVLRKTTLATVVVVALVGLVAKLASAAAKPNNPAITFVSPSPAEAATLTTDAVSFKFTYKKKPQATQTLTCALSGPTSFSGACNTPAAFGTKGSQSGPKTYSGLADGSYTFTVSLTLTDGGTTSATRTFTVAVPPTFTGPISDPTRLVAPTLTGRGRISASSAASRPVLGAWRSTPATSTGPTNMAA